MLASCVPGLLVVNVDAGFSAGYAAAVVNKMKKERVHHGEHGAHGGKNRGKIPL